MNKTLTATFDGHSLYPDTPLDLEPNKRYVITISTGFQTAEEGSAWDILETLVGTLEAPEDWASEHDHYLYGVPKRSEGPRE